uniref:Adhesion G protein-coupled receptor D2 n=1 Tax=Cavia porcellus TaxID=10141 RepID=H0VXA3_CAVPO
RSGASLAPPLTPQQSQGFLGPQVDLVAPGEVVETTDSVCKFPGQRLSWWQAQESCEQRFGHLALGPPDGILAPPLSDSVWVGQRDASMQRLPQRREWGSGMGAYSDSPLGKAPKRNTSPYLPALLRRMESRSDPVHLYAMLPDQLPMPSLGSVTTGRSVRAPPTPRGGSSGCCLDPALAPLVPSEECPTWNPGLGTAGSELCVQARLFLCCYRKEIYEQLRDIQLWPGQDVISRVNALAEDTVLLPDPLSEAPAPLSLDKACSFLGILESVLAPEPELGPAALLAVVHFLKRVSALGAREPQPLAGPWEQLARGVLSVTSLVLEERLAGTWLSISKVVGGPMALLATVQPLASLLSTTLSPEQPRIHIQYRHMGLSGVTAIHSWFSSSVFQRTLGAPSLKPQFPASPEEASRMQRFLSTQVGSAVLSSELQDAAGPVSTAVTFHLRHQAQELSASSPPPSPETGGSWATTSCSVLALHRDSTACFCNHSTSFAILLQVYDVQRGPEEESLLRTLSFVGCGVSFCALATTFLLFLVARVPKSERTTVHKNLTFSLASAEGLLMASEWAKTSQVACVAVTAAMHLLFLAAFSWMLVEGLLLWSKVVAVSMRPGPRMWLYYTAGWGSPTVIVAVTLVTSPGDYVASGHCWLNVHTDAIWAFAGPVLFVLAANTCILFRVVTVTVSSARRRARMLSPQPGLQQQLGIQMWATVKPVLVLLPVLGLTWLVGVLVHLSPAWAYAAVGLNSLQGPYIFLVYAACNAEVRNALQRVTEKKAALAAPRGGPDAHARAFQTRSQEGPTAWSPPRRHLALRGPASPPAVPRFPLGRRQRREDSDTPCQLV